MYVHNFGLIEALEVGAQSPIRVMSQEGVDFLKRAALSQGVSGDVVCDPHPSIVERMQLPDGEAAVCINGLITGLGSLGANTPANGVVREAMAQAEAAGYELMDPEWYENMVRPTNGLKMSSIGLHPSEYGFSPYSPQYPKNTIVQGGAAVGITAFMGSRDPNDLFEVEDSLISDGGKSWSWETSVPGAVYDGVQARRYLQEHPDDLQGAFRMTSKGLFQPWNR